jgi:hypothetical protein
VLQVHPVPVPSTRNDSGNIERAQAGCRFPGVENAATRTLDGIDVGPRGGCYSGCALEQVQQGPLGLKDGPKLSSDNPDD